MAELDPGQLRRLTGHEIPAGPGPYKVRLDTSTPLAGDPIPMARVQLTVTFADGTATYWETAKPAQVDVNPVTTREARGWHGLANQFQPSPYGAELSHILADGLSLAGVELRIRGGHPYFIRAERTPCEITPDLAERAAAQLQALLDMTGHPPDPADPLAALIPYLLRIAGPSE